MAKILMVYGTTYGQTEKIVRQIERKLENQGQEVSVWRGDKLPAGLETNVYDAFLIAASVIGGKYQRYIRDFVRTHVKLLNAAPSAFVSVSGTAAASPQQARQHAAAFLSLTDWRPTLLEVFGGAMAYSQYGFLLRWIMKVISRRRGGPTDTNQDYEMTDWNAVERFAMRFSRAAASTRGFMTATECGLN